MLRTILSACVLAVGLAGCDKCGHRLPLVAPTIQHACGDDAQER